MYPCQQGRKVQYPCFVPVSVTSPRPVVLNLLHLAGHCINKKFEGSPKTRKILKTIRIMYCKQQFLDVTCTMRLFSNLIFDLKNKVAFSKKAYSSKLVCCDTQVVKLWPRPSKELVSVLFKSRLVLRSFPWKALKAISIKCQNKEDIFDDFCDICPAI